MNTLPNPIHGEWVDSVADWAAENAAELRHFNGLACIDGALHVTTQGRPEQGWPARRCSPEVQPHIVDRLRESYDREDQSDSADGVFWLYMAVIGAVIAAAIWAVWA